MENLAWTNEQIFHIQDVLLRQKLNRMEYKWYLENEITILKMHYEGSKDVLAGLDIGRIEGITKVYKKYITVAELVHEITGANVIPMHYAAVVALQGGKI